MSDPVWVFASSSGAFAAWPRALALPRVPLDLTREERPVVPVAAEPGDVLLAFTADGDGLPGARRRAAAWCGRSCAAPGRSPCSAARRSPR